MRLPWVSRAAFDLSQHNAQMLRELVKAHADERYDKLLAMYHELRMKGAEAPLPVVVPSTNGADPYVALDPRVALFLDAKFVAGTPLWRQQYGEARKLMAAGAEPERIIDTLGKGQTVEF